MKKSIQDWLNEYGESHQNPINKVIHWVCVPLIMLSLIGLIKIIPFPEILKLNFERMNWAFLFLFLVSIYYFKLSKTLFLGMVLISFFLIKGINQLESYTYPLWQSCSIIFVLSWIGQFIGHKIEGIKPSFFKDIQFLLIGPAWLLSFIYKKLHIPL